MTDGHLLLAADVMPDAGAPVVRVGATADGGPLVWAFTDADALAHWDHAPVEQAVIVDSDALFAAAVPPTVVLNAAGPAAQLLHAGARPPSLRELPDAETRARLRERAQSTHEHARAAGDPREVVELLAAALDACRELGDRLHQAAAGRELATALDALDETVDAAQLREECAATFDLLGEAELARDTRADGIVVRHGTITPS